MAYGFDSSSGSSASDDEFQPGCFWKPGEDFLQNTFHFPSFKNLPHDNDIADGYWEEEYCGVYQPGCTWFFMAEITNDEAAQMPFMRNTVVARDRAGRNDIRIAFYPEDGYFDFQSLKKGSTLLVTNGLRHDFLDLTRGLRIEALDSACVAPCSVSDLLLLSKLYHERKGTRCWSCGTNAAGATVAAAGATVAAAGATVAAAGATVAAAGDTVAAAEDDDDEKLKKCAACRMGYYCSKACQKKDWKEGGHKRMCKAVPVFRKLAKINYTMYDKRAFWGRDWDRR